MAPSYLELRMQSCERTIDLDDADLLPAYTGYDIVAGSLVLR